MKKNLLIIILSILMQRDADAQTKLGFENYGTISKTEPYLWIPIVSRTGKKGLHTEFRYNYEEKNAASVYIGKKFGRDSSFSYAITPMMGWVFGDYNGASLALNADAGYKKFYVSAQSQYTWSKEGKDGNFFYLWGEAGYEATDWFYAGLSNQLTKPYKETAKLEYGILAGFNIKKLNIPVYVFSPFNKDINLLIGINLEL